MRSEFGWCPKRCPYKKRPAYHIEMAAEQEKLLEQLRVLAEKAKELMAEHARVVAEFTRVQERILQLDRENRKSSN